MRLTDGYTGIDTTAWAPTVGRATRVVYAFSGPTDRVVAFQHQLAYASGVT